MKSILYLCGAGNPEGVRLALKINEREKKWGKIFILDDDPDKKGKKILGIEILGSFDLLRNADPENVEVVNLVARTTVKRKAAYDKISVFGVPFVSLIDPSVDTFGVQYNGDIIIYQNVIFSAGAFLDQGSVVFTGAVVGHGCTIGRFCIIAPGAVLNARIIAEEGVYIGTNASIIPDLKIGAWATIALNSGVIQNVPAGATVMGVPAEIITLSQTGSPLNDEKEIISDVGDSKNFFNESQNLETTLIKTWKELLNTERINLNDNFFELGGNSLLAVQLFGKLKNEFGVKINLTDIFHYPTIKSFMEFLERQNQAASDIFLSGDTKRVAFFRQRFTRLPTGDKPDNFNIEEMKQE